MPATTRLITYGDSLDMAESRLEEVVNGELRTMPPPDVKHQELVDFLADGFKHQLDRSPPELLVEVYSRPYRKGNLDDLLSDYASIGVPELWHADTDQRLLPRLMLEGQRLQEFQTLSSGSVSPIRLPSVLVQIEPLWQILVQ